MDERRGWGRKERDVNEMAKEVTERDMVFLLHGFQGLPLPGSGVARQASCVIMMMIRDGGKLCRGVTLMSSPPPSHLCVQSTDTCLQYALLLPRLNVAITEETLRNLASTFSNQLN